MSPETDPRDLAADVIMDALQERPDLFVALHFLGLLDGSALRTPERELDPQTDRVIVIMDQIEPVAKPVRPLREVVDVARWQTRPRHDSVMTRGSFARWVNGEISYHPSVLGWPDEPGNWPRGEQ